MKEIKPIFELQKLCSPETYNQIEPLLDFLKPTTAELQVQLSTPGMKKGSEPAYHSYKSDNNLLVTFVDFYEKAIRLQYSQ